MREFETGATRDNDEEKIDPDGFFSPLVFERFCQYMHEHRKQADGKLRDSDNWQKGIPPQAYMKSLWRHFKDVWTIFRGWSSESIEDALCGVMFNAMGLLHEILKKKRRDEQFGETNYRSACHRRMMEEIVLPDEGRW